VQKTEKKQRAMRVEGGHFLDSKKICNLSIQLPNQCITQQDAV